MKTQKTKTVKSVVLIALSLLFITSCGINQSLVKIPANQKMIIDYPEYDLFSAQLMNQSLNGMEVKVISKENQKTIRGFGLNGMGNAKVMVEKDNQLVLANNSNSDIRVKLTVNEESPKVMVMGSEYVRFTLENTSNSSIPLWIPTVMNPNLSPNSKSGVELKYGQEIFFRDGIRKYLLLKVDRSIKAGEVIDVLALLEKRKKEIDQ